MCVCGRGLGKTVQIIALFAALHASQRGGPCLVVAPATVMQQVRFPCRMFVILRVALISAYLQ